MALNEQMQEHERPSVPRPPQSCRLELELERELGASGRDLDRDGIIGRLSTRKCVISLVQVHLYGGITNRRRRCFSCKIEAKSLLRAARPPLLAAPERRAVSLPSPAGGHPPRRPGRLHPDRGRSERSPAAYLQDVHSTRRPPRVRLAIRILDLLYSIHGTLPQSAATTSPLQYTSPPRCLAEREVVRDEAGTL